MDFKLRGGGPGPQGPSLHLALDSPMAFTYTRGCQDFRPLSCSPLLHGGGRLEQEAQRK